MKISVAVVFFVGSTVFCLPAQQGTETLQGSLLTTNALIHSVIDLNHAVAAAEAMPLNKELIGMSIEFGNIVDFLGDVDAPNQFSRQLLQNIQDIKGSPPVLRLGGNTQDLSKFCESCPQTMNTTYKPGSAEATNVTFNKNLFKVMNENTPSNQRYIFGLNLGQDDIAIPTTELQGAMKYLNQSKVLAYELGNEPDHYVTRTHIRPPTWWVLDYCNTLISWLQTFGPQNSQSFAGWQIGSMAGPLISLNDFSLVQMVKMKVQNRINNVRIMNNHNYPANVCTPENAAAVTIDTYTNHIQVVQMVNTFQGEVKATKSIGLQYHFGETNSAACHGKDGVSNTHGAALWQLDYALESANIGVDRIFFHNGKGDFFYSMWELGNSTLPAHVNPTYFGMLFMAEATLNIVQPKVYRIKPLDTFDLAHYAIYDADKLLKLVVLNTHLYNDTTTARPARSLDVRPLLGDKLTIKRLTAPSTISKSGTTWVGQTVDSQGNLEGERVVETVRGGEISIAASEAVIIERQKA